MFPFKNTISKTLRITTTLEREDMRAKFVIMGESLVRACLIRPCAVMSKDAKENERNTFERCFVGAKGLWMPDKHNGHGGYQDLDIDAQWSGWITRAILQNNQN